MDYEEIVQPKEFCVTNVFHGTEYVVPIYQRNCAWKKDEIEQLLNDINDVSDNYDGKYYLGSLIVNQLGPEAFEVIDGQQRLTTLYLLLSYLNQESVNKNSLRFEAREKSNMTLHDINLIKDATTKLVKEPWYSGPSWDDFTCESFDDIRNAFADEKFSSENKFTLRSKLMKTIKENETKEGKEDEEKERLESVISFPNFVLQVNEAMNLSNADDAGLDDKKFIELLKENWSSRKKALEFIYSLLKYRFYFDRFIIKREYVGQYRVEGKWSLQKLEMYKDSRRQQKRCTRLLW